MPKLKAKVRLTEDKNKHFDNLNEAQKSAVVFGDGPLLIVAGAGTGKTTVITRRIAYLISQGIKPDQILALTFTEKAATEMEERVDLRLPYGYYDLWISTFHAFCERVLKQHALDIGLPTDFKIYEPIQQKIMVRKNLSRFALNRYRPLGNPNKFVSGLVDHFGKLKEEEISPKGYLDYVANLKPDPSKPDLDDEEIERLREVAGAFKVYQDLLLENNALDFGDLINYTLHLFRTRKRILSNYQNKFKYILVDEFQDTNYAQYEMIKLLASPTNNLTVVGDDDQSIYKFRGASIYNILQFKTDYPGATEITLVQNYRSSQNILDTAYNFIQLNNPDRLEIKLKIDKRLRADVSQKGLVQVICGQTSADEVDGVIKKILEIKKKKNCTWNDFAILLRANNQAELFISQLSLWGIPYTYFANKGLYKKPIIFDLISYFKILLDHQDDMALYKVLNLKTFQISHLDLVAISHFRSLKAITLYQALERSSEINDLNAETSQKVRKLLEMVKSHGLNLTDHTASEIAVKVIRDSGIWKEVEEENYENLSKRDLIEQFYKKIERFEEDNSDKSLRNFMEQLNFEQEAGEEGKINFNPDSGPESVKILTVHASKGLEFTYVFIVNMVSQRFPSNDKKDPIDIPSDLIKDILMTGDAHLQEERRLFYVAITRAKRGVFLTYAGDYGGQRTKKPSPFLIDIGLVSKPEKSTEIMRKEKYIETGYDPSLNLPGKFSFTQIQDFKNCPLKYQYAYVLKMPMARNPYISFGSSIHTTLEMFMNQYRTNKKTAQLDLFEKKSQVIPGKEYLLDLYEKNWIEEGYGKAEIREGYKKSGYQVLETFYQDLLKENPDPKYIEEKFRLKLGKYIFTGKIDRADLALDGRLNIIDYKTGKSKDKPEEDQLLIYQWAAQEYLKEKVSSLRYWYIAENVFSEAFLGSQDQIENLKSELLKTIEEIRHAVAHNSFKELHKRAKDHNCEFKDLE